MHTTEHHIQDPYTEDSVFYARYRAVQSRDARFDGQFITGVHSTGIYCRPSCPAATPKPANVTFYLTTAAAHEAGLRACKRCLPDALPGSPQWDLRDDIAARAMRLIHDGIVERNGVSGLAARLGYTPRHLTRILTTELGAGPLALARAHRAQTARALLLNTQLPMADVAFAAGFGSVRQFNETMRAIYDRTPLTIRAATRSTERMTLDAGLIRLTLPARDPFDARGVFEWLRARAITGVEQLSEPTASDQWYERTIRLPHGPALLRCTSVATGLPAQANSIEIMARLTSLSDLSPLVARVRRLFDLDADTTAIDEALAGDLLLRPAIRRVSGIRLPGCLDPHELLFRTLIGQQISVAGARTILSRLANSIGERMPGWHDSGTAVLFPTAQAIAEHGNNVLTGPRARIRTILDVAKRLASGDLVVAADRERRDLSAALLEIPGIGPWTAQYVAMRVTRDPDLILSSDLALRKGAQKLGLPTNERDLRDHSLAWAPWRSYASMHLWRAAATGQP